MATIPTDVGALDVYAGDTFTQTFTLTSDSSPIDLDAAGWSDWSAQFRKTASSSTAVDFAVDVSQADVGKITISLTPAQTAALKDNGVFDLQATQGSVVRTWIQGSISWLRDITRG